MGNYVIDRRRPRRGGHRDAETAAPTTTWAATSCRSSYRREQAGVYDYKNNVVPGATDRDRGYWRDVGTLASYYAAHMDVVSPLPVFNLYNFEWPIYTSYGPAAAGQDRAGRRRHPGRAEEAVLSAGVVVSGGSDPPLGAVAGGAVAPASPVERVGADERCRRARGAIVKNAILDKNVIVPPGARVGVDHEEDEARGFLVEDGLTVLGKDQEFPA